MTADLRPCINKMLVSCQYTCEKTRHSVCTQFSSVLTLMNVCCRKLDIKT